MSICDHVNININFHKFDDVCEHNIINFNSHHLKYHKCNNIVWYALPPSRVSQLVICDSGDPYNDFRVCAWVD